MLTRCLSLAQPRAQQQLLLKLPHAASSSVTAQVGEISVRGKKKSFSSLSALSGSWHNHANSNGTTARTCSPELVIPYTVKEAHLYSHSWRAGFQVPCSSVSMIMHRKVQISHLLLSSGKWNTACPLPQWHSSHPNHLPIPSCILCLTRIRIYSSFPNFNSSF